jgi:hypothetical protein
VEQETRLTVHEHDDDDDDDDEIDKNEMGGACNTYGRQKRCIQGFGGET